MTRRSIQRADTRLDEIAAVAAEVLRAANVPSPVLAAADDPVVTALSGDHVAVTSWQRWVSPGARVVTPWPSDGRYAAGVLRLPGGWESFTMSLHALCSRLPAGAPLWIYGGSEEGITSAAGRLDGLADNVETVALKRRMRVLRVTRTDMPALGSMADWRQSFELAVPGVAAPLALVSYPGCFAHGRLDEGTRLLLENLPLPAAGARVLDFACGGGVIAATLAARESGLRLTLLDADVLALAAAAENVAGADIVASDGLSALDPAQRFELIVANPPIHRGRQEDFSVLEALVREAPARLTRHGRLVFVVQRTAGAGRLVAGCGRPAAKLAETPAFQVWSIGP